MPGFTAGGHTGVLLSIALAIEYLFVGLSLAAAIGEAAGKAVIIAVPVLLSLLTVGGTLLGVWLLAGATPVTLAGVLVFGAVALMYLATEELLLEPTPGRDRRRLQRLLLPRRPRHRTGPPLARNRTADPRNRETGSGP